MDRSCPVVGAEVHKEGDIETSLNYLLAILPVCKFVSYSPVMKSGRIFGDMGVLQRRPVIAKST